MIAMGNTAQKMHRPRCLPSRSSGDMQESTRCSFMWLCSTVGLLALWDVTGPQGFLSSISSHWDLCDIRWSFGAT